MFHLRKSYGLLLSLVLHSLVSGVGYCSVHCTRQNRGCLYDAKADSIAMEMHVVYANVKQQMRFKVLSIVMTSDQLNDTDDNTYEETS